jgi:hypothetical protein
VTTTWHEPAQHGIRACRPEDLSGVGALWMRTFRRRDEAAPEALVRGLGRVFFESPFASPGVAPLVLEGRGGGVVGFIGLMPRRLELRGKPLVGAVATQLMVDPSARGFAAFQLLRAALGGPQDLTFSDGANTLAQSIWQRVGGEALLVQSLEWLRILRPAAYAALRLERAHKPWIPARALRPLARAVEPLLTRVPLGALRPPPSTRATAPATAIELLALGEADPAALRARPSLAELEWLLERAAESRRHGVMRARIVHGARGEPVGGFVHFAMPGGFAQVLQLGGRHAALGAVLDALLADAYEQGCVAVTGQGEPRLLCELDQRHAVFTCPDLSALIHSAHPAVLTAVHRGDASLSRLDGEWWLPFAELADASSPP